MSQKKRVWQSQTLSIADTSLPHRIIPRRRSPLSRASFHRDLKRFRISTCFFLIFIDLLIMQVHSFQHGQDRIEYEHFELHGNASAFFFIFNVRFRIQHGLILLLSDLPAALHCKSVG
jgi:hypothetical protein